MRLSRVAFISCHGYLDPSSGAARATREALDGTALDLPEGTLAGILVELQTLEGRVELVACRLADALDPAGGFSSPFSVSRGKQTIAGTDITARDSSE
jgi:hypothetical protein